MNPNDVHLNSLQDVNWGSSTVGQVTVYQVTGTVTARRTVRMMLMNMTAVSYSLNHPIDWEDWEKYSDCDYAKSCIHHTHI